MITPWGPTQQIEQKGGGIIHVSTASHGGLLVPPAMYDAMPAPLRQNAYGGGNWFEEDCEWALVALAFPQHFTGRDLYYAVQTINWYRDPDSQYHAAYLWLTTTDAGRLLLELHQQKPEDEIAA